MLIVRKQVQCFLCRYVWMSSVMMCVKGSGLVSFFWQRMEKSLYVGDNILMYRYFPPVSFCFLN